MDEEISNTEKTSPLSFVPALGLLGLCIAVVAVALGIFSMVKVSDTSAEMNDKIEKAAALSIDMKKLATESILWRCSSKTRSPETTQK